MPPRGNKGPLAGSRNFEKRGIRMPVYTVHAPYDSSAPDGAADKFVFVRDGFHVWALIFGPVWLLWYRLWLGLIGWLIVVGALWFGLKSLGVDRTSIFLSEFVVAILMGLEAVSLRRWALSRERWRQLDVVVADDEVTAERRFFERWSQQRGTANDQGAVNSGGPPLSRSGAVSSLPPLPAGGIVGLFPEPGGTR